MSDFKVWDEQSQNILTQQEYESRLELSNGFQSGLASSALMNKVLRNISTLTSALGALAEARGARG